MPHPRCLSLSEPHERDSPGACPCREAAEAVESAGNRIQMDTVTFFVRRDGDDDSVFDLVPQVSVPAESLVVPQFR